MRSFCRNSYNFLPTSLRGNLKKTFVIRSPDEIKRVTAYLEAQPLDPLLEVEVKLHKKDRSLAQNSLYWQWITLISNEWGWTKDDTHDHFKGKHLVKIYERDEEGYASMIQTLRLVYTKGMKQKAQALFKEIARMTSTTSATTKQFTEYLGDIEKEMIGKGFPLPHPDDYNRAMGVKK